MKELLRILVLLAALGLAPAWAQPQYDPAAAIAAQREAMKAFAAMDGVWRGPAWSLLPSGEKRFPYYGQKALAEFGAVIQHQIVQRSLQEIAIRLVARRRLTQVEEEQLRTTVLSGLGHAFRVDFEYVDEIKREPGGKFAEFRCEVPD